MKSLRLITLGFLCIVAPLAAQDTTHARHPGARPRDRGMQRGERAGMDDMMPMMREMMGTMMRFTAYTPDHLLARKDSLRLTADQVSRLTTIRDAAKSTHDAAAADMQTHMGALAQAFQVASPDTSALKPHFDAAHAAMGKAHWAMLSAAAQARAALTDAQRQQIDAWVTAMGQREQHENH